jgi:Tfp pilus assembly PilM family ATPase
MLAENESILGLEIEPQGIKIMELKKTLGAMKLIRAKTLTALPEFFKNGIISNPKAIAKLIKDYIQSEDVLAKKVVGVISPSLTLARLVRIPFMSEIEMKSMLEAEADQYVDFKHKEKVIDFCLLEEINEEGIKKVNVIFAAVLKNMIDGFIHVSEEANLELIGIDAAILATTRALYGVNIKSSSVEPIMLVIINPKDIQLCILKGNRPRFLHTVEIDIKEFLTTKEEFIERLIFSIKLVLNYYSRVIHGQEDIRNIVLSLNDSSLRDIDRDLLSRLEGFVIEKADPLGRLKVDDARFSQERREEISLSFAQIIGAVLRTEDPNDYPLSLNLVPLEKQQRLLMNRELALYASSLTILLMIFVIVASMFWLNSQWVQFRISRFSQQLKETTLSLEQITRQQSKNINLDKRINESSQIIAEAEKYSSLFSSSVLVNIMLAVPEGLWLKEISIQSSDESLILTGSALTKAYILEYAQNLTNKGYFSKVEPIFSESPTDTQQETLGFIIKCQLKRS